MRTYNQAEDVRTKTHIVTINLSMRVDPDALSTEDDLSISNSRFNAQAEEDLMNDLIEYFEEHNPEYLNFTVDIRRGPRVV